MKNIEYVILCSFPMMSQCFVLGPSLLLCSGREVFLSFTGGFDSGKQLAEGGRGRNRGKLKEICIIYF